MTSVFISGSRHVVKLSDEVKQRLSNIIQQGFTVFVGDANGADKAVQNFLLENSYNQVIVFCSGNKCRNNLGNWQAKFIEVEKSLKGRDFYTVKDIAMAQEADYALAIWDGKSQGTLNNINKMLELGKKSLVYLAKQHEFLSINKFSDVAKLHAKIAFNESQQALAF